MVFDSNSDTSIHVVRYRIIQIIIVPNNLCRQNLDPYAIISMNFFNQFCFNDHNKEIPVISLNTDHRIVSTYVHRHSEYVNVHYLIMVFISDFNCCCFMVHVNVPEILRIDVIIDPRMVIPLIVLNDYTEDNNVSVIIQCDDSIRCFLRVYNLHLNLMVHTAIMVNRVNIISVEMICHNVIEVPNRRSIPISILISIWSVWEYLYHFNLSYIFILSWYWKSNIS